MTSPLAVCALTVGTLLAAAGCGGSGAESGSSGRAAPKPAPMATGELGRLQQRLERGGYSVVVIDPRELPSRAPLASAGERRRKDLPKEGRPELGLRVELAPDAVGLVYRYSSSELATAIAPSFLGWARTGGVYGCGRNVFFARRGLGRDRASRVTSGWLADTTAALKRLGDCAQAFMDIT